MKVFYNKNFPVKGYIFNCFGFLFAREGAEIDEKIENHELIHCVQMVEVAVLAVALLCVMIPIFGLSWWWLCSAIPAFYVWYGVEWFYQWVWSWVDSTIDPYKMITFEQEAYANDQDLEYLKTMADYDEGQDRTYLFNRMPFAWVAYMFSREVY